VAALNKAERQFVTAQDELERFVVAKEGESMKDARMQPPQQGSGGGRKGQSPIVKAIGKGGMLLNRKNPAALARQEDDVRARMSSASNGYHKSKLDMQGLKSEFFNLQLPRTLRVRRQRPWTLALIKFHRH
jgi:Rho GTPase-activating protein RGD1